MRINLNVPFAEKDAAKKRGAKWDGARRTWYVSDKKSLDKCKQRLPEAVSMELVDAIQDCIPLEQTRHLRQIMSEEACG